MMEETTDVVVPSSVSLFRAVRRREQLDQFFFEGWGGEGKADAFEQGRKRELTCKQRGWISQQQYYRLQRRQSH